MLHSVHVLAVIWQYFTANNNIQRRVCVGGWPGREAWALGKFLMPMCSRATLSRHTQRTLSDLRLQHTATMQPPPHLLGHKP